MPNRDRNNTSRPDAFDRAVDYLLRELPLGNSGFSLELPPEDKIASLAGAGIVLNVSFERFVKAARHVLRAKELSQDDEWNLRRQFREAEEKLGRKVSLADLKAKGQEMQPGQTKSRSQGHGR